MRSSNDSPVKPGVASLRHGLASVRRDLAGAVAGLLAALLALGLPVAPGRAEAPDGAARGASVRSRVEAVGGTVAAPPDLAALLAGFREMPGFEARFEEQKTLALLAAPLESRGRLFFSPPSTLLRRVETPNPHDILIREHVVRIATPKAGPASGSERSIETIDLARRADVRPLVESMLWIFSGDVAQLESIYAIDYQVLPPATRGGWTLRLAPRSEPLSRLIRELAISGHGRAADRLEITETSGDRTTTRILDPNPERRFAAGEIERLFGLETP